MASPAPASLLSLLQGMPAEAREQLHALLGPQAPVLNDQVEQRTLSVAPGGETSYSTAGDAQKAASRHRFVSVLNSLARGQEPSGNTQPAAAVYEEPTMDALSLLEDVLCSQTVATRLLYHRLDERVFTHITRLRAAHNIPSAVPGAIVTGHPSAGVKLSDPGTARLQFYQAAVAAVTQHPLYGAHHHQLHLPYGAPGMHMRTGQPVTQVPLPLPGPSKSPFPAEQRALLEDAFRRCRTITKDEAHALAQRLCGCVDSTTGAPLPAMTALQMQNWFNNRRKALTKAAREGTADRGGWQAVAGGRKGGRRGRRASVAVRSHRRYDSFDDDDEPEEEGGDVDGGDGDGDALASPHGNGGAGAGGHGVATTRRVGRDTSAGGDPSFNPRLEARSGAAPLATGAGANGERRAQRSTAGKRLLEAGGAAAVEEANDALVEAVEASDRELESRKRFRYEAPMYGYGQQQRYNDDGGHGGGGQQMVLVPGPGGCGERRMEKGDLDALAMCWASIPNPTGQQVAAMAQQLQLSTHQVSVWYQARQAGAAVAAAEAAMAAPAPAAGGSDGLPAAPPAAPVGETVQALLSHLFMPAQGVPSQMQPRMFGNEAV